jgi:hypothetical protein
MLKKHTAHDSQSTFCARRRVNLGTRRKAAFGGLGGRSSAKTFWLLQERCCRRRKVRSNHCCRVLLLIVAGLLLGALAAAPGCTSMFRFDFPP